MTQTDVLRERIAQRAYEIYLFRGGEQGREVEDWLEAERDILSSATDAPAPVEAVAVTDRIVAPKKTTRKKAAQKEATAKPATTTTRKRKKE